MDVGHRVRAGDRRARAGAPSIAGAPAATIWPRARRASSASSGPCSAARRATAVTLFAFLVFDFLDRPRADGTDARRRSGSRSTGHQWWWEVNYHDDVPNRRVTTANEIHIPVGRPVLLRLNSQDVIHSFWVPDLNGKRDLIPGKESSLWIQADSAGVYRGQCAEFCGYQHAKMALPRRGRPAERTSHAGTPARPTPRRRRPTRSPQRGQEVFLAGTCTMCHAIQGTPAGAAMAARPDARRQPPLPRRGRAAQHAGQPGRAGFSTPRASSRAPTCRPTA